MLNTKINKEIYSIINNINKCLRADNEIIEENIKTIQKYMSLDKFKDILEDVRIVKLLRKQRKMKRRA